MAIIALNCFLVETICRLVVAFTTLHTVTVLVLTRWQGTISPGLGACIGLFPGSAPESGTVKVIICFLVWGVPKPTLRQTCRFSSAIRNDLRSTTSLLSSSGGRTGIGGLAMTSVVGSSSGRCALWRGLLGRTRPGAGTGACLRGSLLWVDTRATSEQNMCCEIFETQWCSIDVTLMIMDGKVPVITKSSHGDGFSFILIQLDWYSTEMTVFFYGPHQSNCYNLYMPRLQIFVINASFWNLLSARIWM